MDFKSFTESIQDMIKEFLPSDFKDATVELVQHKKLNEQYTGLVVRKENQVAVPTINLEALYDAYDSDHISLVEAVTQAAAMVQMQPEGFEVDSLRIMDYDTTKHKLFIRVSNAENNQEMLQNAPHMLREDLAITYHIAVSMDDDAGIASTMVNNHLMNMYGITQEQLHEDAMKSSPILFPATVASMGEVMKRIMMADMKEAGMDQETMDALIQDMPMVEDSIMTVITNVQGINGAAAIFYPDQMDKIAERLGGDYFILPSSVHETLVVPDDGKMSFLELRSMVTEINATMVNPSERLTDEVYHYDYKDKVFEKAATFDARQKAKTKQQEKDVSNKDQSLGNAVKTPKKHKSNDMSL